MKPHADSRPLLPRALRRRLRRGLVAVALFTACVNLLMLTGPLFMLQVYDRVLRSQSVATLAVLFAVVVFAYVMLGTLDYIRGRILARLGAQFQQALDPGIFDLALRPAAVGREPDSGPAAVEDIRNLLSSPVLSALFDLPWTPGFLALLFLFHPLLGWLGLTGAGILLILALLNQRTTRHPRHEGAKAGAGAAHLFHTARRHSGTLRALGMTGHFRRRWLQARNRALVAGIRASDLGGAGTALTRAFRLLLQSAMLAAGAWLALRGTLGAGAMIAASIVLGRALAPVEQVVGQWPLFQRAASAWTRLQRRIATAEPAPPPMPLPAPVAELRVANLFVLLPDGKTPVLQGVDFTLQPGEAMAVIGQSAAGKSALAKALTGLWPPLRGEIRLGGSALSHFDDETRARHIGYLPQEVELFAGSVRQNIARFDPAATPEVVVRAAEAANVHAMIQHLPEGYDTLLQDGGAGLSGGQRQRIALARAFFGQPKLLVLDEPDASLDEAGIHDLNAAIGKAKAAGQAVILMSHRPSALARCDRVLLLEKGRMQAFGPRDKVLERFTLSPARLHPAASDAGRAAV